MQSIPIPALEQALQQFYSAAPKVAWLEGEGLSAYMRKGQRLAAGKLVTSLEIATVVIHEPARRGKGVFTALLTYCRRTNPLEILFVENVQEERFRTFFRRQGLVEHPTCAGWLGEERCYYEPAGGPLPKNSWPPL